LTNVIPSASYHAEEQEARNENSHAEKLHNLLPRIPSLHGIDPPKSSSHSHSHRIPFRNTPPILAHFLTSSNLERNATSLIQERLGFLGEGASNPQAFSMVPQIGKDCSLSGITFVSYQISRTSSARNPRESPFNHGRAVVGGWSNAKSSLMVLQSSSSRLASLWGWT